MQIIQNILTIDLDFNPSDKTIYFYNDKLVGRTINAIYVTGIPKTGPVYNPPRPNPFIDTDELQNLGLFLNLVNDQGKEIVTQLSIHNLFADALDNNFVELPINDKLDLKKSFFFYRNNNVTRTAKLRIYILYQTRNLVPYNDTINGSVTCRMDYKSQGFFKDYFGFMLRHRKIKKIRTDFTGSLNIIGHDFEINSSTEFFKHDSPKEFLLDSLVIDYEKSSFVDATPNNSNSQKHHITLFY